MANELAEKKAFIHSAAILTGISSRIITSVLYAERFLNFNWEDAVLDNVLAYSGYNSSVGFGQIKISTAFWIEQEIRDKSSKYYLGVSMASAIQQSKSRDELIKKVINDSINILYCAAYISMIQKRWKNAGTFLNKNNETGILGTLYSLGIVNANGEERKPHNNPQMNKFGVIAQNFFDSFIFAGEFE